MSTSSDHLIGLECWYEISSWGPYRELDPLRRSFQMQVLRVFLSIGLKAMLNGTFAREAARERNRQSILEGLDRKLRERAKQTAGANGSDDAGNVTVRGNFGPCAATLENRGPPRKLRAIFRISGTARRCAVSPRR